MLKRKYLIGEFFGVPVFVDSSFLILLFLFVLDFHSFTYGLSFALILALSVVVHEFAHVGMARVFGYRTRDITLSLLGGCASIIALPRKAWQEFATAIAGPLASFALVLLALLPDLLGLRIENHYLRMLVFYAFWMNLMLGAFNLLPGFPLDGGRIFRSVMRAFLSRAKATYVAMIVGRVFAVLLAIRGLWAMLNGSWGFVSILIAWMIWKEGYREYLVAKQEEDFRAWTQDDFDARVSPPPYER